MHLLFKVHLLVRDLGNFAFILAEGLFIGRLTDDG